MTLSPALLLGNLGQPVSQYTFEGDPVSRTIGLLLAFVGGLAVAAGVGVGATSLVASDETIESSSESVEGAVPGGEPELFIYGSR